MNPWIVVVLISAVVVSGIDFLLRRKKWKDQSKAEKVSLLLNVFSVGPYAFLSVLGLLWGITASSPDTAFGKVIYDITMVMAGTYFVVALAAVILSLIFRKKGKIKASIWVTVIAFAYIAVVFIVNSLVGNLL